MTEEQQERIAKAKASLRAARLLLSDSLIDFAASRADYAMFYIARAFLLGKGLAFSKPGSLIAAFGQYCVKTGEVEARFHRSLIKAERDRIAGDYSAKSKLTKAKVAATIEQAEEFITMAEQRLGAAPPAADPS